jgi:hypothetical protein
MSDPGPPKLSFQHPHQHRKAPLFLPLPLLPRPSKPLLLPLEAMPIAMLPLAPLVLMRARFVFLVEQDTPSSISQRHQLLLLHIGPLAKIPTSSSRSRQWNLTISSKQL